MPEAQLVVEESIDCVRLTEIATTSGHVFGHATLDAPGSLNALSLPMIDRLTPAFTRWASDERVAGVVLDGAGEKAFCAGGDITALYRAILDSRRDGKAVPTEAAAFFEREYRLDYLIHTFPKPVLCWGHGFVMGGGVGLMAGASHRVEVERTRIAMPEITIGLYPDVGGTWLLRRMPRGSGRFLALTGAPLNAADAKFVGLADFVLPQEAKSAVLADLSATGWHGDTRRDRDRLTALLNSHADSAVQGPSPLREHLNLIDQIIGSDGITGAASRLDALAGHSDAWLANAAANFKKGSPTSAAVAYELQSRAENLSLADVFRLEYQVSVGCCVHHDFVEGVRALLIDKDRNPHWLPAALKEVSDALVADHFKPRYHGVHPLADLGNEDRREQ